MLSSDANMNALSEGDFGPATQIQRLLGEVAGVEVGTFSPQGCAFPATCVHSCLQVREDGRVAGVCEVVRRMSRGEIVPPEECPPVCDRGHVIQLSPIANENGMVLVLKPGPGETNLPEDQILKRLDATVALWDQCTRLSAESAGLADELIRSYEQLNVLFDVTQQICKAHNPAQIKLFLIRRLAETLNCGWSCCLSIEDGVLWWAENGCNDRDTIVNAIKNSFNDMMHQVAESRTVMVEENVVDGALDQMRYLIFGPLGEPSAYPDILVFGRHADQQPFVSGDMMMIDSVLSHAQHVIVNLRLAERLKTMSFEAVRALVSAIDKKDRYTSGHSERVGFLSRLIGERIGLSPEELQDLEWGGVLHDVGKIGIRDGVLTKPGRLTEDEFSHIKEHVQMSYDIVAPIMTFESVGDIVLYHHEMPDGTGYPYGLQADEIPLPARIVHVADTFDAVTSTRSYRQAFTYQKALEMMRADSGTKLDGRLVEAFVEAFEAFRVEQPDRYGKMFAHIQEQ